jgi:GT2 family glycosyltransferase
MVDITVVILTHNQKDVTLRCLTSVDDMDRNRVGIIIWNNGSTDGTKAAIEKQFSDVEGPC